MLVALYIYFPTALFLFVTAEFEEKEHSGQELASEANCVSFTSSDEELIYFLVEINKFFSSLLLSRFQNSAHI